MCLHFYFLVFATATTVYLQVSDFQACRKGVPSELCDVIVAQVQGFDRNQLSGPPAIYTADLIVVSAK